MGRTVTTADFRASAAEETYARSMELALSWKLNVRLLPCVGQHENLNDVCSGSGRYQCCSFQQIAIGVENVNPNFKVMAERTCMAPPTYICLLAVIQV